MSIGDRLADNVSNFGLGHRGAPRKGRALLQGIVRCGCCGRHMGLNYSGPKSDHPVYRCRSDTNRCTEQHCQEVRAPRLEAEVERLFLAALAPDQLAITLAALDEIDTDTHALERQWTLKRERAAYEIERARWCNRTSGNSFGGWALSPCRGEPRQGLPILVFHGVENQPWRRTNGQSGG